MFGVNEHSLERQFILVAMEWKFGTNSPLDEEQFNEEEAATNDREGGDDVEGRLESLEPPMIPTP
jgi:hypothetical protein